MRILTTRLGSSSSSLGGAEKSAVLHASIANKIGMDAVVVTNYKHAYPKDDYVWGVHIPSGKILGQLIAFFVFPRLVMRYKPDVCNPHSRFDQIALSLTKWLHRRPVVWKDPGDLIFQLQLNRSSYLARLNQKLLIAAIKKSDGIYTLNSTDRKRLIARLSELGHVISPDKIFSVPSGIIFNNYDLDAKPPTKTNKTVIGTIVQLHEHKGVQYLISAFKSLSRSDIELWIVGDGPYSSDLKVQAKGNRSIRFWGYQNNISSFLNGIDIFVQPSDKEGWGRNLREALYFGKPVIASRAGGLAEQIVDGKNGLLFKPGDVDELTEKLKILMNNSELRSKLGNTANAQVIEQGDFKVIFEKQIIPIFKKATSLK